MPMPDDEKGLAGQTVFVSGAGGFIGTAVVRALVSREASVRALAGAPGQVTLELPAEVEPVFADIQDQDTLTRLATGAATALHLAGPPSVAASFQAPLEYGRVHTGGTLAMLEACRAARVRRFVYLSSAEVYGCPGVEAVAEDHPLRPRSPYAASKAAAEHFVNAYGGMFGMESVVLRPFSVYGPGMPGHSVTATILRQALWEDEIALGDLASVRDYCFIDDVVEGILRAASVPGLGHQTFNLGTGVGTSVGDLACLAMRLTARELPVRSDPSRCRPAHIDIRRLVADGTAAAERLGWHPRVPLADGLKETLEWVEERR
jgi:nucleoside-diphosphate-sugar epimerase